MVDTDTMFGGTRRGRVRPDIVLGVRGTQRETTGSQVEY